MYVVTIPQKNIWNLQKFYANSSISNISGMLVFDEMLDLDLLREAINTFVRNQEGIRLRFTEKGQKVCQFAAAYEPVDIPVIHFTDMEEAKAFLEAEGKGPFVLTDAPMYRFCVFDTPGQCGVFICLSHLVSDAWTLNLFCSKVMDYYHLLTQGREIDETPISYLEYAAKEMEYIKSERYVKDALYWEHRFSDKPVVSHIKPNCSESQSARAKRLTRRIDSAMTTRIRDWCAQNGVSLAVLFEAAVSAYLYKINEKPKETIIGTLVLNRTTRHEKETAGMFVSTMPLGIAVSDEDTPGLLCGKIADSHRKLFRHQKYPYSHILKNVRDKFDVSGSLFDVMVSYQNAHITCAAGLTYHTEWLHNGYSEVPLALHIDDRDKSGSLTINMDYQTDIFSDEEARLLYERLYFILSQLMENDRITVGALSIIPKDEYQKIIFDFNDTAVAYPREKCIHELFVERAKLHPDKTALIFEDEKFTYGQLDEMSNSLAHYLRGMGVKPNEIVPIIAKRSWHIIVAMLGILKAGGAYMPVDPTYPADRIEYMLSTSNANIALTYGYTGALNIVSIDLEVFDYYSNTKSISNANNAEDMCYVLFTSGSTGNPKAVMILHYNLCNFTHNNNNNLYQCNMLNNCMTVLALTTFVFDISVFEVYLSLINGLTIVLSNETENVSAVLLAQLITKYSIDVLHSTPTKLLTFLENEEFQKAAKGLKMLMIGGETFTQDIFHTISQYTDATVYNGYGPAETTIGISFKQISNSHVHKVLPKDTDITIGTPIANTQIYILDQNRNPLPIGIAGELCISGDGVGKGYLNRPDLTAEKFIPNPFIKGKTMYCSGDLARFRADGEIEYLGRIDTQVKIRGLRIELGEIESVMNTYEGIHMCAAAGKRDAAGRQYLAGYYISDNEIEDKLLRRHLSAKLPQYMVPNYFMRLKEMPMTASGKIDRKNLPVPEFTDDTKGYEAPVTNTEKILAEIWKGILSYDAIGKSSDFIACGGDSLGAINMLAEIENAFGIHIEMRLIMEHTVLTDLADCIDKCSSRADVIPVRNQTEYVLTPQQKALYLACQKEPSSLVYNMPMFIRLDGADTSQLEENIFRCYDIHPALRTAVSIKGNEIVGTIHEDAPLVFESFDDKHTFVRPFDLSKAPLIRVGFGDGGMAVDIHHIAADGESLSMILDEIFHGAETNEKVSYADYAIYLNEKLADGSFDAHKEYFKKALHVDIEPLLLPEVSGTGASPAKDIGKNDAYTLDGATTDRVKNFAQSNNLTETCVYLAMYAVLMSGFTNKRQIVSSIVLSNRIHADTRAVCGMFVNTVPVVLDINSELSFAEYAKRLNRTLLDVYQYQELPFLEICETAGIKDKNVINTAFIYQPWERKNGGVDWEYIDTKTHKMDLSFQVVPQPDGSCKIMMEYNGLKYDAALMKRLAAGYGRLIRQIAADRKLKEFQVIGKEEYRRIVYGFNDTAAECQGGKCAHEVVSEKTAGHRDKTALIFREREFTYGRLDEMSNSLAHYLRDIGVKPNDIVPIITKRSWYIVAAMLGVWKAGGAFMPIDPDYPDDRIAYMIQESGSSVILTYGFDRALPVKSIDLGTFDYDGNVSPLGNVNTPEDTCYVIFTSGSTGKPKGVLLKHSGLVNFASGENVFHRAVFQKCSRVLAVGSFAFDISIVEIFLPLLNGSCVVIADGDTVNSPDLMAEAIMRCQIDLLHTTPTRLGYYLNHAKFKGAAAGLKVILSAGETFPSELYAKVRGCTQADIFNGYGPTETTVGCSFVKVEKPDAITIGRPVSNAQIYILGYNGNPCPIGVAGELCIAGAGVGKGYLNRPALTAEKFVKNPFMEGGMMYKSGDLARFRADGEIEYLGRIDTQVKIRGLRIELGEIESVMHTFDGIKMCAAADKRDASGRQYLVGYYTSDEAIDENGLREHLSAKLPKYMVPNFFMRLTRMPVTVSGKTDRKNLPNPSLTGGITEYTAPRNDREKTLCEIAAEILGYEKVGIDDDFFGLGGDSLKAIEYTAEASDRGIVFDLQAVFEYPTVAELSGHIAEKNAQKTKPASTYVKEDFEKYKEVLDANHLDKRVQSEYKPLGNVFLTGATGYLGAHILDSLMKCETGNIYCLVRGNSKGDGRRRLMETLDYYFGETYHEEIGRRIIPVIGDIVNEYLSDERLQGGIQTVIHAAATVKHFGGYSHFDSINVQGTEHMLSFAKEQGARFMFVSTVSVGGLYLAKEGSGKARFDESGLYIGQDLTNVYLRSKFEAERLVLDAKLAGCDCMVLRVGNLTNRYADGLFQPNYKENAFLRRMKTFVDLKAYPSVFAGDLAEFSPVDLTAEAIVRLAECSDGSLTIFHVNHPKGMTYEKLAEMLCKSGYTVEPVQMETFLQRLSGSTDNVYDSVKNEMNEVKAAAGHAVVVPDSSLTQRVLRQIGFEWPQITQEYIDRYVKYFDRLGYWKQ